MLQNTKSENAGEVDPVAGKTFAEILGEITWLMTQDKNAKQMPISDIERLVMPAILLKQFHIQYAEVPTGQTAQGEPVKIDGAKPKPNLQPVSVELYAMVSDAVKKTLEEIPDMQLTLQDWRSGHKKQEMLNVTIAKIG